MQNFFDWFDQQKQAAPKTWLILGKGPSFSRINEFKLEDYNTISLNHVIRELKVKIAHTIDFDVVIDCQNDIDKNAEFLLLPYRPNVQSMPGEKVLPELIEEYQFLKNLKEEKRLLWYDLKLVPLESEEWKNLITGAEKNGKYPIVPATFFSVEAAVNLLAHAGEKTIRSLGIDGGATYSTTFKDIKDKTLLVNGQKTFNIQFLSIAKTTMEKNINYSPITVTETPIKVFVGTMPEQMLGVKVLEYSIKKYASMSVDVFPLFMSGIEVPMPKDPKNRPRTPFSFQRFMIPQLKNFKGRGIYVDSDMQVFKDIKELWEKPMEDCEILAAYEASGTGRKPQFAVMLLDCEKLKWNVQDVVAKLDSGELTYEQLMYNMAVAKKVCPVIEREWNSLEYYEAGKTCLVHYTDMDKQPWLFTHNPLTELWLTELCEAIDQKFITVDYVIEEIKAGNVRPSLLYQIKHRILNPSQLPAKALKLDKYFIPPHMRSIKTSKWKLFKNKIAISVAMNFQK